MPLNSPSDFDRSRDPELAAATKDREPVERGPQEIPSPVRFDDDVLDFRANGYVEEKDFSPKASSALAPASAHTSNTPQTTPGLEDVTSEDLNPTPTTQSPAPDSAISGSEATSTLDVGTATSSSSQVSTT